MGKPRDDVRGGDTVSRLDTRINKLRIVYRAKPTPDPTASDFNVGRLSLSEQIELDDLVGHLTPVPSQQWDFASLSLEQLERVAELTNKAKGKPPSPAYRYMKHRDPGIGPCLCEACLAMVPAIPGTGVSDA